MKHGKSSEVTALDCVSPVSNACTDGKAGAFRLRRDERFGGRTRWFLSDPSSPARVRIHRLRPLLSDNDVYIKVGGWLSLGIGQAQNWTQLLRSTIVVITASAYT